MSEPTLEEAIEGMKRPGRTWADAIRTIARGGSPEIDRAFSEFIDSIEEATRGLASQVRALQQSALRYDGTWQQDGREYARGSCVTWDGSLWIARRETTARPGDGSAWQLAVKHGRDGRDR